ncbi:MAG: hypothetical protein Unbinned6354contig1000_11 [Prokaryotic dsDNA virus sp.]|nr:hypothetical protein [Cytophagaceae bacterium]QDP54308.1 MAG: hypothetical protein Unbinned6354contig1000_11 [Prokaryotic dsDNA virus sp.]|tara:strand:+ start:13955 stop:14215 length:261 start_codon:yes stop_codon:yes gene_type:complete
MKQRIGKNRYVAGDYLVKSDRSGRVFLRSQMRKTWDGLLVHHSEWEPKHPQQELRVIQEQNIVDETRVESDNDADLLQKVGSVDEL